MVSNRYLEAVAAHVATTLHQAHGGVRCRCGACRHRIAAVARQLGVTPERLGAALPPERPAERRALRPRGRRGTPVASTVTVTRGQVRAEGEAALLALVTR